jgi:two-component system chemotaxis response regulator CheB
MESEKKKSSVEPRFIVVMGTSAGGFSALTELVQQFDKSIDAALFIVMHLSYESICDFLVHRLQQFTELPCQVGDSGMIIERGHIYIAPSKFHMQIKDNHVLIGRGHEETRWRPSIDVLFRSAAASYGGQVIGIVLTGLLNDGTAGMVAIKECGGKCIVQDPTEAEYPSMPMAVLNSVEVDACVALAKIGDVIKEMTSEVHGPISNRQRTTGNGTVNRQ